MAKLPPQPKIGTCNICLAHGELSFEHVPPKAAFNRHPVILTNFEETIQRDPDSKVKGPVQQKGAGWYSLCARCNNFTGAKYGAHFVEFAAQGMESLRRAKGNPDGAHFHQIRPLSILKQILSMFMSINGDWLARSRPGLTKFILDPQSRELPPEFRMFAYFNCEGPNRTAPAAVKGSIDSPNDIIMMSELAWPPFGYLMTFDSRPPDNRLLEITSFREHQYRDVCNRDLYLRALPTWTAFPGDYRSKKEVLQPSAPAAGGKKPDPAALREQIESAAKTLAKGR